ncbi:hypothetical protein PCANC_00572 [Puccinia coronata f. sp. avenae]|uniref:Uncharacterized protein n=1 Tax=Puccinia coronata f. sp. avenae TaxID=200324 RepID=A0A2N5W7X5_9BASI|nr:hypothetical protein PCANC_00572 [Puccinia coronata f. sp. avenae]
MTPFPSPSQLSTTEFEASTLTIRDRSLAFRNHALLEPIVNKLYDPSDDHGVEDDAIPSRFYILACYTSNDPQQAFEHPLHVCPARDPQDPISVLQFSLDPAVLHGEIALGDGHPAFQVLWCTRRPSSADSDPTHLD